MVNCKNYKTDGGNTWVVGGTLVIEEGATVRGVLGEPQVQTDWNEDDTESVAYIKNKPEIPEIPVADNVAAVTPAGDEPTDCEEKVNAILVALKAAGLMEADADADE